jgi:hypothetical protein
MTRIILRLLNAPILILLISVGIAIQSALFYSWPIHYFQPDVVLLAVVWCALSRDFEEGGIITLIIANINEIHSAAPQGFFMISYMLVYLLIRAASRVIMIPTLHSFSATAMAAFAGWRLVTFVLLSLMGAPQKNLRFILTSTLTGILVEGAVGFWLYRWFDQFDRITFRRELQLDDKGI